MRTVEICLNNTNLPDNTGRYHAEFLKTLGYLATWGAGDEVNSTKYATVRIWSDTYNTTDFVAHYYDGDDNHTYTIGAVWHGDHYGTHS